MSDGYIIAIDIGTTNIEAALVRVDPDGIGTADMGHAAPESGSDDTGTVDPGCEVKGIRPDSCDPCDPCDPCDHCEKGFRIMSTILQANVNRKFGRDVMTRITQAERGNLHQMSTDLRQQLSEIIKELIREVSPDKAQDTESFGETDGNCGSCGSAAESAGTATVDITRIVIACNTTMTHILLDEDCHNLGVYPFSPVHIDQVDITSDKLGIDTGYSDDMMRVSLDTKSVGPDSAGIRNSHPVPVTVLPGFSAFVGGDIMAGVISLDLMGRLGRSLLIDLGTNGEMVYHDKDSGKILVTSTAAGPAFELAGRARATDIIEGIAELRSKGIIDETGLLADEYFESGCTYGEVNITQQLIRDVQTAKAAVRTGIEILLEKAEIDVGIREEGDGQSPDLEQSDLSIFLSGAFGDALDIDAAIAIGMFPESFRGRVTLCGNTALSGAIRFGLSGVTGSEPYPASGQYPASDQYTPSGRGQYISSGPVIDPASGSQASFTEIYLANEDEFNDLYIENIGL